MADIEKIIKIIFGADTKAADAAFASMGKSLSGFSSMAGNIADPLAGAFDNVVKTDAALAAMAAGGLALAVSKAADFNAGFSEVNTMAGTTGAATQKFKEDILAYATESTQSIDKINGSLYQAISLGVSYDESIGVIKESEKLAVAGKADLVKTTETLVGTMNAYGASMDEAGKYSDIMFTTVKDGKTTIPELGASLSQVTGIAATAKVDFGTLSAAIAGITATGMPTSQAITAIKEALSNIVKPSAEAGKEADALGLKFNAQELASKGLAGMLTEVYNATGGNITTMGKLFGSVEALNGVMILGSDKSGIFKKALEDMANSSGATQKAFDQMKNNFDLLVQNLKNNVDNVLVAFVAPWFESFGGTVVSLADVFKGIKFGLDSGAFKPLQDALKNASDSLNEELKGIAFALPQALGELDFTKFLDALGGLGGALTDLLFGDLDLTKPDDLAKALQGVIDAATGLINISSGMADALAPFAQQVKDFLLEMGNSDQATTDTIGNLLLYGKAISDAGLGLVALMATMQESGVSVKSVTDMVAGGMQVMWNGAEIALEGITLALLTAYQAWLKFEQALTLGQNDTINANLAEVEGEISALAKSIEQDGLDSAKGLDRLTDGIANAAIEAEGGAGKVGKFGDQIKGLPDNKEVKLKADADFGTKTLESFGYDLDKIPKEIQTKLNASVGQESFNKVMEEINKIPDVKPTVVRCDTDAATSVLRSYGYDLDKIPTELKTQLGAATNTEEFNAVKAEIDKIPGVKTTEVKAATDSDNLDAAAAKVKEKIPDTYRVTVWAKNDETGLMEAKAWAKDVPKSTTVSVDADKDALSKTKKAVDAVKPEKKWVTEWVYNSKLGVAEMKQTLKEIPSEVKTKVTPEVDKKAKEQAEKDLTVLKGIFETVKTSIEWKAKLDIAEVEANAKKVEAIMKATGESAQAAGKVLESIFGGGQLDALVSHGNLYAVQPIIDKQIEIQQQALEVQKSLAEAEIAYMKERTRKMASGEAMLTVNASGMEPHLNAIFSGILKSVQSSSNEELTSMLLGIAK